MALIKCPECQKEISDVAKSCPNCGYSLISKKKKTNKQRIVGVAIILLLIFINLVGNAGIEAIPLSIIFGIIGLYLIIKKPKQKVSNLLILMLTFLYIKMELILFLKFIIVTFKYVFNFTKNYENILKILYFFSKKIYN